MDYIKEGLDRGTIKLCPSCETPGELASGCNYIKCPANIGTEEKVIKCNFEWCWMCSKPKYKVLESKKDLGCCNDKTHNSH